jgi:hypothetical protein
MTALLTPPNWMRGTTRRAHALVKSGETKSALEAVEIARREAPGIAKLLRACTCRGHAQPYWGYPAAGVVSTSPRRRATGLDQQSDAAYMVRTEFNPLGSYHDWERTLGR